MENWKQYIIGAALILILPALLLVGLPRQGARPQYGKAVMLFNPIEEIPNPFRKIAWLDGKWEFRLPGDKTWHDVAVPHVWNSIPGLENYEGQADYRIKFKLPKSWKDGETKIHFGGCAGKCTVALNGKQVVASGALDRYMPFTADVTGIVFKKNNNILVVNVNNKNDGEASFFATDEKNFGGIFREVYIERSSATRFEDVVVEAHPTESGTASVRVKALITMPVGETTHIFGRISREKGPSVADFDMDVISDQQGEGVVVWTGGIPNAELWSPESPVRYELTMVTVTKEGSSDGIASMFGIRRAVFKNGNFELNGEPVNIHGVVWREQFPNRWGPIVTNQMIEMDFEKIKLAGFNAVRFTHPVHPAVLDYCDRNGILVFEDFPLWKGIGGDPAGEVSKSLTNAALWMNDRDKNHPSVIAFGMGRGFYAGDVMTNDWMLYSVQALRRRDPGRMFYADYMAPGPERKTAGLDFVIKTEYPGWTGEPVDKFVRGLDVRYSEMKNKSFIILNYGAGGVAGRTGGVNIKGTETNQLYNLAKPEEFMRQNPAAAGWFIDTFSDYEGARLDPRALSNTVPTGLLTIDRRPKPAYEWFAGIADENLELKKSKLPFRFPAADFFTFLLLLMTGLAIWSGFSKMWPAFIEPDLLGPNESDLRWVARNFLLFGLPMLLIAGAAASFSAAGLMDMHPFDGGRLPMNAIRAANIWLRPFAMRFMAFTVLQIIMLVASAMIMSPFLDGEPLRLFELLARCSALRFLFILIPFLPVSPWFIIILALGWETYMQSGAVSRVFNVAAGSAAGIAAGANALVLAASLLIAAQFLGGIGFLF
jgi:beta-galactosidase